MGPGGGSARGGRTAPFAWPRDVGLVGSHLVLAAPKVTFPTKGAQVDPAGLKVTWQPVTSPVGVKIVSYQVIVNRATAS